MSEFDKERLYLMGASVWLTVIVLAGLELIKDTTVLRMTMVALVGAGAVLTLNIVLLASAGKWPGLVKTGRGLLWVGFGFIAIASVISALCIAQVISWG